MGALPRWLSLRPRLQSRRGRILGAAGILLVALLIAGLVILRQRQLAAQESATAGVCAPTTNNAAVVPTVTVGLIPPGVTLPVTLATGEPRVVATVNSEPIYAVGLELRVAGLLANHRQALQQAPTGSLPPDILATLKETPNQIRHDALTEMIQECLLLQEGKRLGLTASLSAAQAMARQELQIVHSAPASSPVQNSFATYLRVNHLTEQTFLTNPEILHGYVDNLTIAAVNQHIRNGLPPGEAPEAGINAYVRRLWQTGNVRVYLPSQLGW